MTPGVEIDRADHVVLGVGDVEDAAPPRPAPSDRQRREPGRSAVAGVALLAGPGHVMDGAASGAMR